MIFTFAGFNGFDFHIRWIQLVVDFFVVFSVTFVVTLFVHRGFFAVEDYLYRALRLIFTFAGFNGFDFHIRWIQLVVDFFVAFFVSFVVTLFVHRDFLWIGRLALQGATLDLHIRWIQLSGFSYSLDSTCC